MKFLPIFLFFTLITATVFPQKKEPVKQAYLDIGKAVDAINLVMVHDVISPPAAARYYAYCMLGAYEMVHLNNKNIVDPASFIKQFPANFASPTAKKYNYQIAALYCILETGKTLLPSGDMLQDNQDLFVADLKKNKISQRIIDGSIAAAKEVSAQIVAFSKGDHYNQLSAKLRYTPKKGEAYWYPTPPAYLDAVEPNWRTIRPLMIDSAAQFKPKLPVIFSKEPESDFYKQAKEVYSISINPPQENLNKASFWDCNPFAVTTSGHMMIGFKKISPGGHWMNIAGLAVRKKNLDFDKSVVAVSMVASTLMDAFISCWDEKYRSNRIRPETYINKYIDIKWKPLLQTPPFPEYTSGHAVISNASAEVLTYLLGNNFAYTDNTEIPFGVGPRSFTSFNQAAEEASISRLYGGIHFRDSVEEGNAEGRAVAKAVIATIKKAGILPFDNL